MPKLILLAAIAAAIGLPSVAAAQTSPTMGSIICRPAAAGETPNATVQNKQFLCKPVSVAKIRKAMTDAMAGLSPDQQAKLEAAMNNVFKYEMSIEAHYPGYNGNPNN